ncbi:MAG TPA: hypothetical protein VHQ01_06300 [Pyrinomonadaceae bacterium]|nr:hypothetical protein [Pyrinomonadaceae bacterium]
MSRNKCRNCGLVNAVDDLNCRRCGVEIGQSKTSKNSPVSPRDAAKNSSWLYTLLFIAIVGGAAYYLFSGVERSYNDVKVSEANRVASQPNQQPEPLTNRTDADQKRAGSYKTAIQNSPGLSESQKHNEETKKLMEPQKQ